MKASLDSPPYSRALEEEECQNHSCEKTKIECDIKYESSELDSRLSLYIGRRAAKEGIKGSITG